MEWNNGPLDPQFRGPLLTRLYPFLGINFLMSFCFFQVFDKM